MKKTIAVAMATIILLYACAPKISGTKNKLSVDNGGKPMLIGTCTQSALKKDPFKEWFK